MHGREHSQSTRLRENFSVPPEQDLVWTPAAELPLCHLGQGQTFLPGYLLPPVVLHSAAVTQGSYWMKETGTLGHPRQKEVRWSKMNPADRRQIKTTRSNQKPKTAIVNEGCEGKLHSETYSVLLVWYIRAKYPNNYIPLTLSPNTTENRYLFHFLHSSS